MKHQLAYDLASAGDLECVVYMGTGGRRGRR